jgi:hypothetical protein
MPLFECETREITWYVYRARSCQSAVCLNPVTSRYIKTRLATGCLPSFDDVSKLCQCKMGYNWNKGNKSNGRKLLSVIPFLFLMQSESNSTPGA